MVQSVRVALCALQKHAYRERSCWGACVVVFCISFLVFDLFVGFGCFFKSALFVGSVVHLFRMFPHKPSFLSLQHIVYTTGFKAGFAMSVLNC